jgi:hypothetical protein
VTTITTFFLEAFCLFITSERVSMAAIVVTPEVHEYFAGNISRRRTHYEAVLRPANASGLIQQLRSWTAGG